MEEYIIDGEVFSKDTLQTIADKRGYTFDELLQKNPNIQVKTSPVNQSAFAEPGTALNMESNLGSTSLESQEDDTFIERALGKNIITDFFGDIYRSAEQGFAAAQAVGENLDKKYMFTLKERLDFIKKTHSNEVKIKVKSFKGLTIDFCKSVKATAIIRGLRNPADFEFEKSIAQMNRRLSGIETLFLLTAADYSYISSSIVREIIKNNGDYSSLVPDAVLNSK